MNSKKRRYNYFSIQCLQTKTFFDREEQLIRLILEPIDVLSLMKKMLCNVMNNIPTVNSAMVFTGFSIYLDSIMPKGH